MRLLNPRRSPAAGTSLVAALVALVSATTMALVAAPDAGAQAGDGYVPLAPARILDTRSGLGAAGPVAAGASIDVKVTGVGGVPESGVGAVVLNVTATNPTEATFVTVWPTGQPRPTASNLNVTAGESVPNLVIATVGDGGRVSLFNYAGNVDLLADVSGWFPAGGAYTALTPERILDTRGSSTLGPGGVHELQVLGRAGVPDGGVAAVVMNVTATNPTEATFITVYPAGHERPTASNLNVTAGESVPNLVVATVTDSGLVALYNYAGNVDLVVDVAGWFPYDGGTTVTLPYWGLTPARILDTRTTGPVGPGESIDLKVTGAGGVRDSSVGAVVLNVTATDPTEATYVSVYPKGQPRPEVSNLNVMASQSVPNAVIATVGADGSITLFNYAGSTNLIVDVAGWFPGTGLPGTGRGRLYTNFTGLGVVDMSALVALPPIYSSDAIGASAFTVNPGRNEFAYTVDLPDPPTLFIHDLSGTRVATVPWPDATDDLPDLSEPDMSPDGQLIVALEDWGSFPLTVAIADRAGNLVNGTGWSHDDVLDWEWTPAGDLLVVVATDPTHSAIALVPKAQFGQSTISPTVFQTFEGENRPHSPAVSADGTQAAFGIDHSAWAMPLVAGGQPHELATSAFEPSSFTFSPAGNEIALCLEEGIYGYVHVVPNHRGATLAITHKDATTLFVQDTPVDTDTEPDRVPCLTEARAFDELTWGP